MKLRSIPPRTCITIARNNLRSAHLQVVAGRREIAFAPKLKPRLMRPQISRKPFEEKLAKWQEELDELAQWASEGLDISKVKKSIEEHIRGLLNLLEGN